MKNVLLKDTFREIRRTLSRFFSIFAIVALGVGFFAGIKVTCPDMKLTADKYYDDFNMMDIRVVSTLGLNDDDISAIKNSSGIQNIFPAHSMDVIVKIDDKDTVFKLHGLPLDKINSGDESYINRVKVVKGRYPEKSGECLIQNSKFTNSKISIGSTIELSSGTDKDISENIKTNKYTVVGIVETPYYISYEMGSSSIGSGKIDGFIMIPESDFKMSVYTDAFLTVTGAKDELSYNDSYSDIISPVKKNLETAGKTRSQLRYDEIVADANKKIDKSRKELQDGEAKQKEELSKASAKLDDSRKQIHDGELELESKEKEFNNTIKISEAKIAEGKKKLESGINQYNTQLQSFNIAKQQANKQIPDAEIMLSEGQKEIDKSQTEINAAKAMLAANPNLPQAQKEQIETSIKDGEQKLSIAKSELDKSKAQLEAQKKQLSDGELTLALTKKTLDNSQKQLDAQEKTLASSKKKAEAEFTDAHAKLEDSKKQLEQGEKDYESSKEESEKKLAEAREKIADAEDQLSKLEKPKWYVLDRNTNIGFVEYGSAADRIDAVAKVFPVFFFLVAALVCLTTMTRMVDEQRIYIGTMKALGYGKFAIASKYLLYAALASVSGSLFGLMVGFKVLPIVISNAYGIIYTMPPIITKFNIFYAVTSSSIAVLATTLAAWSACSKDLILEPAALMRPKAPKSGKRILLEKISFVWSKFNFTQKITARNLFRYKKRFLMTVLGICGCTALLLTGFGLRDSIMDIVAKQFDEIYKYNMVIELKNSLTSESYNELISNLAKDSRISGFMPAMEQNVDAGADNNENSATLVVPESTKKAEDFILFRTRTTGERVPFKEDGVILTEKLAKKLQVGIGDEIYIKAGDSDKMTVKVSGITENYISHYIYMPPSLYQTMYGEPAAFHSIMAKISNVSQNFQDKLSTDLLKNSDISSVNFTTGISKNFDDMLGSLDYVIIVIIAFAGALAFVVLYNLTNVNVAERLREIATIKVLGFFDNEVSSYVYRENFILTIIGLLLGLVLGIFLHRFVIVTVEIENIMFGRNIKALSYLYSSVLTVFFSGLVNFVMYFKLKKINMVESLKSVD